jgi:putative glutamine amidotransferase
MKKLLILVCLIMLVVGAGCNRSLSGSRPVIGITSVFEQSDSNSKAQTTVGFAYVQAVLENGGVPVILPTVRDDEAISRYVSELDGLVLIGGLDIPPAAYGQEKHETVKVMSNERYEFERRLIKQWLATDKPILGICLGMQFTNVVTGGSMIQDIPSQVSREIVHRGQNSWHNVRIEKGSRLAEILGSETAKVYSSHHQGVDKLGRGLKAVAYSSDGVIEALERTEGGFGLFVQWHPEAMMNDLAHRDAIYSALVKACK